MDGLVLVKIIVKGSTVILALENLDVVLQRFQLQLFLHFDKRGLVGLQQLKSCRVFSHLCVSRVKTIAPGL